MSDGGHNLVDSDRLIRHCPRRYYEDGDVTSFKAFCFTERELKEDCPFLSFSWLEHICKRANIPVDTSDALDRLEGYFPRDIKKDVEAWIVFSCDRIKAAITKVPGTDPKICFMPDEDNPSHVGVLGYEKHLHREVASKLLREVRPENVHPVTRTRKRVGK